MIRIITWHIPACKIVLFGSRARGDFREGADIDIAIDAGSKIDTRTLFAIYGEINRSTIPVSVDVVDMNRASEDMRKEIERDGILWLTSELSDKPNQ